MTAKLLARIVGLAISAGIPIAVGFVLLSQDPPPADSSPPAPSPSAQVAGISIANNPPILGDDYNPSDLNAGSRGFPASALTVNQTLPSQR